MEINIVKALVIGAAGFVGGYLIDELKRCGYTTYATKLDFETLCAECDGIYDLDVTDGGAVRALLKEVRPDKIFHLAAQSSVKLSWDKPELTVNVNVMGALNLLSACKALKDEGHDPRVLMIGSAEEYGKVEPSDCPIKEEHAVSPKNVYALTKMTQNYLTSIYFEAYGLDVINVRAFNHTGPKQSPIFVVSDFCKQVSDIEKGLKAPVISVGNLEAMRDFTDVRDIVRAYVLLAEKGQAGQTYNVGSGRAVKIADVLALIVKNARVEVRVEKDMARMRPSDVPIHYADVTKITEQTGWKPCISLEQTIKDTLDYFRKIF